MKSWTLRVRAVDRDDFLTIRGGEKKIETRTATKNIEVMEKAYHLYPGYKEKIKKFGIIAFWLTENHANI